MSLKLPRFYAILDPCQTVPRSVNDVCAILLTAGVKLIQYRDKHASSRSVFDTCASLVCDVSEAGAKFVVNDRADIAVACGAHGVHVGQEDLPVALARKVVGEGRWVGFSTHDLEQVALADRTSADYIAFGPIFATQSKENPDAAVGIEGLRRAREATKKPLVAIGGITVARVPEVMAAGADSVAVISDLLRAADIAARAQEFLELTSG